MDSSPAGPTLSVTTAGGSKIDIRREERPGGVAVLHFQYLRDSVPTTAETISVADLQKVVEGFENGSSPILNRVGDTIELLRMSAKRLRLAYRGATNGEYDPATLTFEELRQVLPPREDAASA